MNKADLLMAGLRQLAAGKAAPRTGIQSATAAKDGKDKAEHFREQLRLIAQGTKHAAKPAVEGVKKDATQSRGSPGSRCESCGPRYRPGRKAATVEPDDDIPSHQAAAGSDVVASGLAWSGSRSEFGDVEARSEPCAFCCATMTQPPRAAQPQIHVERQRGALRKSQEPTDEPESGCRSRAALHVVSRVRRDADRAGFKGRGP